eukprot:s1175_g5.t1
MVALSVTEGQSYNPEVIGLSIGFTGIWAQSLISATSFLVMVNANKFVIIGIEAFGMHTKVLSHGQILGACLSILGGILYGKARSQTLVLLFPMKR